MNDKIAVYLQDSDNLASFLDSEKVVVFEKTDGTWSKQAEFPLDRAGENTLSAQRTNVRRVIEQLGSCRIIAGSSLVGVAYHEFERHGFHLLVITSCGPEVFEQILADIRSADETPPLREDILKQAHPVETDTPGVYFFDLALLQKEAPQVSSKQALRDFLEHTPFLELRLVCAHLPPWLESGPYDIQTRKTEDGNCQATIRKKTCGGDSCE